MTITDTPQSQNSDAIFGITNIFEHLLETTPEDAAEREKQQIVNIASAANEIPTLEHLVLHTLPAGEKLAGDGAFVPHMDVSDEYRMRMNRETTRANHMRRAKTGQRILSRLRNL